MALKVKFFGTYESFRDELKKDGVLKESLGYLSPDWKYLAGIIDGEGCIGIVKENKQRGYVSPRYRVRLSVTQNSEWFLNRLKVIFGGFVTRKQPGSTCHHLMWWDNKAGWILKHVYPYLMLKREQTKVAFEFLKHKANTNVGRDGLSQKSLEFREGLKQRMHALNGSQGKSKEVDL